MKTKTPCEGKRMVEREKEGGGSRDMGAGI
jgi:hypothetical protein